MKTRIAAAIVAAITVLGATASAAEGTAPNADEALKVVNYYFDGKDSGPLLLKTTACLKVDEGKDSRTKNDCVQPVSGPVKKGEQVSAWLYWLVPVGAKYDDVTIQFLLDGAVRETKDVELTEGIRLRTWRTTTVSKAGKWTIKVQRAGKDIASVDFDVK